MEVDHVGDGLKDILNVRGLTFQEVKDSLKDRSK